MRRLEIILLFGVGYFFYYLARYNYPIALPFIKEEYAASSTLIGLIATALTLGYALGQFINGFLVDRVGPRIMFTIGGIGAAIANIFMGANTIFGLFILGWMMNGYFQAMGYPSTLKLIANWFGDKERGKPLGVSEFLQSAAAIVIPVFAAFLAATISWRLVFIVPAIMLGLFSLLFYARARNAPPSVTLPSRSKSLRQDINESYRAALSDWRLLIADISYGCTQFVRYTMITWIPAYFVLARGSSIWEAGLIAATFQIGGLFGSLAVGYLADLGMFYTRRWMLISVGMLFAGIAGMLVGQLASNTAIIVALMVAGAGIEALEVAYFLTPVDYLGQKHAAVGVGCMNAVGKAMASLQGVLLGFIIDRFGYGSAFAIAGMFGLAAAVLIVPSGLRRKSGLAKQASLPTVP